MAKTNVILIGMPACGKSFISQELSLKLQDYVLYDIDNIIEKTNGMTISEIFSKYSEEYFRKLEHDTIKMVCTGRNKIISTGGGAFENPDNRCTLLNFGTVFYLKTDIDTLYYRVIKERTRPLLESKNPEEKLKELLEKRESQYKKAHYIIDTSKMDDEKIVNFILENIDETNITRKC